MASNDTLATRFVRTLRVADVRNENKDVRTMGDLAEAVGLSCPTVSKYFHDPNSVREKTRTTIEAGLKATPFRPNIFAVTSIAGASSASIRRNLSIGWRLTALVSTYGSADPTGRGIQSIQSYCFALLRRSTTPSPILAMVQLIQFPPSTFSVCATT